MIPTICRETVVIISVMFLQAQSRGVQCGVKAEAQAPQRGKGPGLEACRPSSESRLYLEKKTFTFLNPLSPSTE